MEASKQRDPDWWHGPVIFGFVAAFVVMVIFGLSSFAPKAERPYVLTVVSTKLTGGVADYVSMQEFSTKLSCSYAMGFINGATTSLIAECLEK